MVNPQPSCDPVQRMDGCPEHDLLKVKQEMLDMTFSVREKKSEMNRVLHTFVNLFVTGSHDGLRQMSILVSG